jgi:hypothetical protein
MAKSTVTQTKMIGLRVAENLYSLIEEGAEREGVSPTAYTRFLLVRTLNYCEPVPETKARKRTKKKPVSNDLKAAVEFLGLLIDVKMNLSFVSRKLCERTAFGSIKSEQLLEQRKQIERATADLTDIRNQLIGDGK